MTEDPTPLPDPTAERWHTPEVAAWIGASPATIHAYRSRGEIPAPDGRSGRAGRFLWWHPQTIIDWHAARPRPRTRRG